MSLWNRVRGWLKGESKSAPKRRRAPSPAASAASRAATKELESFIRSRHGVEAYLEPKTTIYSTTLLLVAADGEYLRRPVRDRDQAREFCEKQAIPLYDAARVGYPKRMRDYEQGRPRDVVSLDQLPPWPGDDGPGGEGPDDEPDGELGDDPRAS